jgi:hypothetical protein
VRAFVDIFPESVMLSGADNELILMGTAGPSIRLDLDALRERLEARPAVATDLRRVDLGSELEIVGTFAASASTMRRASELARPVTDD